MLWQILTCNLKKFSPAAAGIVMYIVKHFCGQMAKKKQPFFYMSRDLKQSFAYQIFLGVERYVFLFDTLVPLWQFWPCPPMEKTLSD